MDWMYKLWSRKNNGMDVFHIFDNSETNCGVECILLGLQTIQLYWFQFKSHNHLIAYNSLQAPKFCSSNIVALSLMHCHDATGRNLLQCHCTKSDPNSVVSRQLSICEQLSSFQYLHIPINSFSSIDSKVQSQNQFSEACLTC